VESVERFGVARGLLLGAWRLLRCNPFSHGGFDPVPETFTLRVGPIDPADHHRGASA
jgi:putative component of membrane protein insertase Oxa1/YidC/SpoIIIJ protein YidD